MYMYVCYNHTVALLTWRWSRSSRRCHSGQSLTLSCRQSELSVLWQLGQSDKRPFHSRTTVWPPIYIHVQYIYNSDLRDFHKTVQHKTTQHVTTQHNTTQHNTTRHNTTQHKSQGSPFQRNMSCLWWDVNPQHYVLDRCFNQLSY